jgi:hypothetical protein
MVGGRPAGAVPLRASGRRNEFLDVFFISPSSPPPQPFARTSLRCMALQSYAVVTLIVRGRGGRARLGEFGKSISFQ